MKTSKNLIVVDDVRDWPKEWHGYPVVSAADYLNSDDYLAKGYRVINLCRCDNKLSMGYYTSLLAEARSHRVMPTSRTIQSLASKRIYEVELEELEATIQRSLSRIIQEDFSLSVYFGQNLATSHAKLSQLLFNLFPSPLFKVQFAYRDSGWEIASLKPIALSQVPKTHLFKVKEAMDTFLSKRWRSEPERQVYGYDLAILHDPTEKQPPSNAKALRNLVKAGASLGINVELITRADYPRLLEFDALFIRETTNTDNHTYRFATKAEREGMVVIDDPDSIRRCCNKVYLHELLRQNKVSTPRTEILSKQNIDRIPAVLGYPLVLKIPDSAFSLGVFKVDNEQEYRNKANKLLKHSDLVLAQEFLPTDFDWRIGVLNQKPLFACRYFMSSGHWQIYNHSVKGEESSGDAETIPVEQAPEGAVSLALKAANLIGTGLYGVDIKQRGEKFYVIEVNDNPNIDAGVEDECLGPQIYERIMRHFLEKIEASRPPIKPEETPQQTTNP